MIEFIKRFNKKYQKYNVEIINPDSVLTTRQKAIIKILLKYRSRSVL